MVPRKGSARLYRVKNTISALAWGAIQSGSNRGSGPLNENVRIAAERPNLSHLARISHNSVATRCRRPVSRSPGHRRWRAGRVTSRAPSVRGSFLEPSSLSIALGRHCLRSFSVIPRWGHLGNAAGRSEATRSFMRSIGSAENSAKRSIADRPGRTAPATDTLPRARSTPYEP
jgi:hypothetical protein